MTNYWWEAGYSDAAVSVANKFDKPKLPLGNVYFGSDCWSQTKDSGDGSPDRRKTFGFETEKTTAGASSTGVGYGGAATGLVTREVAKHGFGIGIFASGWAYGHCPAAKLMDRYMWDGTPDLGALGVRLEDLGVLECRCPRGIRQHIQPDFKASSISAHAKRHPAGLEGFFYTDYQEPVSCHGGGNYQAHIGQQSIFPLPADRSRPLSVDYKMDTGGTIVAHLHDEPLRCSICLTMPAVSTVTDKSQFDGRLILHTVDIRGDPDPDVTITYRRLTELAGVKLGFLVRVGPQTAPKALDLPGAADAEDTQTLQIRNTKDHITALAVSVQGPAQAVANLFAAGASGFTLGVVDVCSIAIKPTKQSYPKTEIKDVKVVQRGADALAHRRLVWSFAGAKVDGPNLPLSVPSPARSRTSRLAPTAGGERTEVLGRAYALEFILNSGKWKHWREKDDLKIDAVQFEISGVAFDGSVIGSASVSIPLK